MTCRKLSVSVAASTGGRFCTVKRRISWPSVRMISRSRSVPLRMMMSASSPWVSAFRARRMRSRSAQKKSCASSRGGSDLGSKRNEIDREMCVPDAETVCPSLRCPSCGKAPAGSPERFDVRPNFLGKSDARQKCCVRTRDLLRHSVSTRWAFGLPLTRPRGDAETSSRGRFVFLVTSSVSFLCFCAAVAPTFRGSLYGSETCKRNPLNKKGNGCSMQD